MKLQKISPYFLLCNKEPNFSHLRVFGSLCFASTISANRTKFQSRGRKCIVLGHKDGIKGYILFINFHCPMLLIFKFM